MSYCLNPLCQNPQNPPKTNFCLTCGTKLLLKDRYRAIAPIGQGGFGRTFLAVDEDKPSRPRCVIKQFFPQAQGTSTAQKAAELFLQEAVRLDELGRHPQIPELLAHFSQDDRQYLVQEFIDGPNLAQELMAVGAFDEARIIALLKDLLPLLQFVHDRQVIHRDIKPENIICRSSDTRFVLVDFGAAKVAVGAALLNVGTSIGSPEYVAPEQVRGRAVFASDIYSLGVTCIHLLTQVSPFDLYDIDRDTWNWRQYLRHPLSESLGKVLDKMLETVPNQRYQSASEVLQDLNSRELAIEIDRGKKEQQVAEITQGAFFQKLLQKAEVLRNPTAPAKSAVTSIPTALEIETSPAIASKSQVDLELEALKAELRGGGKSKNSGVDAELEEMKSQFLGSTTPKKPPQG